MNGSLQTAAIVDVRLRRALGKLVHADSLKFPQGRVDRIDQATGDAVGWLCWSLSTAKFWLRPIDVIHQRYQRAQNGHGKQYVVKFDPVAGGTRGWMRCSSGRLLSRAVHRILIVTIRCHVINTGLSNAVPIDWFIDAQIPGRHARRLIPSCGHRSKAAFATQSPQSRTVCSLRDQPK
jgi:hypothetical protein